MADPDTLILDTRNDLVAGDLDTFQQLPEETQRQVLDDPYIFDDVQRKHHWDVVRFMVAKSVEWDDARLADGWKHVHVDAASGALEAIRGASEEELGQRTSNGRGVLHLAAQFGRVAVIDHLIVERGLDVDGGVDVRREDTPLHEASKEGDVAAIERLVELGARVNLSNLGGPALLCAAFRGHVEAVACLLRLGADVRLATVHRRSALHYAARSQSVETLDLLVQQGGVDINMRDSRSHTPLVYAVNAHDVAMVRRLLTLGATMCVNRRGNSPLHVAAQDRRSVDVVRALLEHGADRDAENDEGYTAREVAVEAGRGELVAVLDSYWPITPEVVQLLLGMKGPTESPLTRFAQHSAFEPGVLSLVKCFVTGEDKGAFSQLVDDVGVGVE